MGQIKNIKLHIVTDIKIKYNMLASLVRRVKPVQASVCSVRNIQTTQTSKKHTLPDLPYDYNALEPVISAEIMQLHQSRLRIPGRHENQIIRKYRRCAGFGLGMVGLRQSCGTSRHSNVCEPGPPRSHDRACTSVGY